LLNPRGCLARKTPLRDRLEYAQKERVAVGDGLLEGVRYDAIQGRPIAQPHHGSHEGIKGTSFVA
jgi:hypothetical protein